MTPTPYDIVREACVKANPGAYEFGVPRDIRLSDVLLALSPQSTTYPDHTLIIRGRYLFIDSITWDLTNDSLEWHRDNQPGTVSWLASLITSN